MTAFVSSAQSIPTAKYYWRSLSPLLAVFLLLQALLRFVLAHIQAGDLDPSTLQLLQIYGFGLLRDVGTFAYFVIPLELIYALRRRRGRTADALIAFAVYFIWLFTLAAEYLFWDEFQTRFNFIAVDYLIYTREVVDNIRESYALLPIIGTVLTVAVMMAWLQWRRPGRITSAPNARNRWLGFFVISTIAMSVAGISYVAALPRLSNNYADEIARNGIAEFFAAFWNNELDYEKFYVTKPLPDLLPGLQNKLGVTVTTAGKPPIWRHVSNAPPKDKYNLVFITVESLSADYLGAFGNQDGLTPNLDRLAKASLIVRNLYATGTRTVFGLSALTLSIPPTPGNSIVRRPDNGNLASLGGVLNDQGYVSKFIYGGYGYFDNMNAFFDANGYEVVDRAKMNPNEIVFSNAWGVSDEDLFNRVLTENDAAARAGKPFFDMVMTTSNHRPFTYPDGRIDLPSKTAGRLGGVKYTDYAIGSFIEEAKKHDWFDKTIFVIVADHTAGSAGKSELDPGKYHIPCLFYAPGLIQPGVIDGVASQIDVVPTVLALLGVSYDSQFYGANLVTERPERAFISNYQRLGYLEGNRLVLIKPVREVEYFQKANGDFSVDPDGSEQQLDAALGYFEAATQWRSWSRQQ